MFPNCCGVLKKTIPPPSPLSEPFQQDSNCSVPGVPIEMMRSKSESRILQPTMRPKSDKDSGCVTPISCSARSLFEASALRVALHDQLASAPDHFDTEDHGIPVKFVQAYIAALRDGNPRWATDPAVSQMFAENAKLYTQDNQTVIGRVAVLKRLEKGVETLLKMAGKDAAPPECEKTGPVFQPDTMTHLMTFVIKQGMSKITFALQFTIVKGKISELKNSRL